MKKHIVLAAAFFTLLALPQARALDQIGHDYRTVHSVGMGGVFLTTGTYDDNFFGNPAQVTQDPKWKIQLTPLNTETTWQSVKAAKDLSGGGSDMMGKISGTAGNNLHVAEYFTLPGIYLPNFRGGKWSYAFGLLGSVQSDIDLRDSFQLNPQAVVDVGPAVTIGRKFLELDRLAVGVTGHYIYRFQTKSDFKMVDLIKGLSPASLQGGGEGGRLDFDLGTRYILPWTVKDYEFSVGAALNNLIAGKYMNSLDLTKSGILPDPANRTLGVGVSAKKASWWKFTDTVLALDVTDMGNNPNGSVFRLIHIGAESHWSLLSPRLGINQGYLTAGLGIDLKVLVLEAATYGEEMSLNAGGLEDRRYVFRLTVQI